MPKIFGHVRNKSIIYKPGIYNSQIRSVTFPDQEKLLEKIDLRYLKTLKTKKLNTKIPRIKHFLCSNYEDIQTRFVQFTDQKKTATKVTKNWSWLFLISKTLKISNINTDHKFKITLNMKHNLQARIVQFTDQKKVWIGTNSTIWSCYK